MWKPGAGRTGNTCLKVEREDKKIVAYIQKGTGNTAAPTAASARFRADRYGNGGRGGGQDHRGVQRGIWTRSWPRSSSPTARRRWGRPVTLFFTFWGLNALRKHQRVAVKKSLIDAMFGRMMPRGLKRLTISKMNMMGMGTLMMKKVMRDKHVNSLPELVESAMKNGVKIIACTMSMDVMGITREELIDGIEYAGVGTYLGRGGGVQREPVRVRGCIPHRSLAWSRNWSARPKGWADQSYGRAA